MVASCSSPVVSVWRPPDTLTRLNAQNHHKLPQVHCSIYNFDIQKDITKTPSNKLTTLSFLWCVTVLSSIQCTFLTYLSSWLRRMKAKCTLSMTQYLTHSTTTPRIKALLIFKSSQWRIISLTQLCERKNVWELYAQRFFSNKILIDRYKDVLVYGYITFLVGRPFKSNNSSWEVTFIYHILQNRTPIFKS